MADRSWAKALRSPVASTVFAVVFGFGGLAIAGDHTAGTNGSDEAPSAAGETPDAASDAGAHGAEVSTFATSTDLVGWHKGAAISDLASDGKSQAGEHGPHAGEAPGGASEDHASEGDHASGDHASQGDHPSQGDQDEGAAHAASSDDASDHAETGMAHTLSAAGHSS